MTRDIDNAIRSRTQTVHQNDARARDLRSEELRRLFNEARRIMTPARLPRFSIIN